LWHIMKLYSFHGFNDFVILVGYKGYYIKEYFYHYYLHNSDVRIDVSNGDIEYLGSRAEPWKITLVDTGLHTMTGARINKARHLLEADPFMLTYGDGLADIDICRLVSYHQSHGKLATVTSSQIEGRFGALETLESGLVKSFSEKPRGEQGWINAGFFVFNPGVFHYLRGGDDLVLEQHPLKSMANDGELMTYHHHGFWKPCDSLWDKKVLEKMWDSQTAAWRIW